MNNCLLCGKEFNAITSWQKYCSNRCRKRSAYNKSGYNLYNGISKASIGAICELRACEDLLSKGFEVFRSVSPACSSDLVIKKDNKLLSVEVRIGAVNERSGRIDYHHEKIRSEILSLVLPNKILYILLPINCIVYDK